MARPMRNGEGSGWAWRLVLASALPLAFAGTPASAATITGTFSNSEPIAIADGTGPCCGGYTPGAGSPYPSTIAVSGLTGSTTRVRVTLSRLSHTRPDDLDILVQAPNTKRVMLLSDAGEAFAVNDYTVTFDEDAGPPPDGAQLTASSYATKNYFGGQGEPDVPPADDPLAPPAPGAPRELSLNAFNGSDPNGTWKLWVADDRPGETGPIAGGWSLAVETEGAADITATAGRPFSGLVARVGQCDCNLDSATIDWGDGSSSPATLSGHDARGTHTYAAGGTYALAVRFQGSSSPYDRTFTATATVSGPAVGGGGGGGGPSPVARISGLGTSAKLKRASWLSAFDSRPVATGARIIAYKWDFNNDKRFDVVCGVGSSAVSHPFRTTGSKTVGLQVVDSLGGVSSTLRSTSVARTQINTARNSDSIATCENPNAGNQPSRADCIKTFQFNIVDVNGRGREGDCFQITSQTLVGRILAGRGARASAFTVKRKVGPGDQLGRTYHATIKGPVSINGLYVPAPAGLQSEYDSFDGTVGLGTFDLKIGQYTLARVDLSTAIPEYGRNGRHNLGRVSLRGLSKLGSLPVDGHVSLDLTDRASRASAEVKLPSLFSAGPGQPARGALSFVSDNTQGLHLDDFRIDLPHVLLGGLQVDNFFLAYSRPNDSWDGGADLRLLGDSPITLKASPPPPDNGFGIKGGALSHAGGTLIFSRSAQPEIFPGISLHRIGFSIGTRPTRFLGSVGLSGARQLDIDGTLLLVFAGEDEPYEIPAGIASEFDPIVGRRLTTTSLVVGGNATIGTAVGVVPLGGGYVLYEYPNSLEFGGGFDFRVSIVSVSGQVRGFAQFDKKKFNVEGTLAGCVDKVGCLRFAGVVSSTGVAACGTIPVPAIVTTVQVPAGFGYRWGDSFPKVWLFSCDLDPYRAKRAQAGGVQRFTLPAGLPAAMVRLEGTGGAPIVNLTGPKGEKYAVPVDGQAPDSRFAGLRYPEQNLTLLALNKPAGGTWTIEPQPGSPALRAVAVANGRRPPKITGRVTGRGAARTLHYAVADGGGRSVTFVEQGTGAYHVIGTTTRASGALRFAPATGTGGKRRVLAVVDRDGVPGLRVDVTTFRAAAPGRPARPRRVRVVHRGGALTLNWGAAKRAATYAITLRLSDGRRLLYITRKRSLRVRGVAAEVRGTVRVAGRSKLGRFGAARSAAVRAQPRIRGHIISA